jgi:hypothetical protein
MDDLRGRYRFPSQDYDVEIGTSSAVFTQTFVADSIKREERKNDGLNAIRGAVNGLLISLVFWVALGVAVFSSF